MSNQKGADANTNTITELRSHLFDTIRSLRNSKNQMDVERARAVAEVAQTIINTAKVEVEHLKVVGGKGSGFIPEMPRIPAEAGPGSLPGAHPDLIDERPGVRVLQHKLKG